MRNDFDARRQDTFIDVLYFVVQCLQAWLRIGALAELHDAFDHIVVIHHLAVFVVNGLAQLPQADLGPLRHHGDIAHPHGGSVLRFEDGGADVVGTFPISPTTRMFRPAGPSR